jgi:hypothetical protein
LLEQNISVVRTKVVIVKYVKLNVVRTKVFRKGLLGQKLLLEQKLLSELKLLEQSFWKKGCYSKRC